MIILYVRLIVKGSRESISVEGKEFQYEGISCCCHEGGNEEEGVREKGGIPFESVRPIVIVFVEVIAFHN